jgi:methyl-accepting chemotaxis protein
MFNFDNFKLKQRILGGYAVPLALIIASTTVVILSANKVEQQSRATDKGWVLVRDTDRLELALYKRQANVRAYLLNRDEDFSRAYTESVEGYNELIKSLDNSVQYSKPEQAERLQKLKALGDEISKINFRLISLRRSGKNNEVLKEFSQGKLLSLLKEAEAVLKDLNATEDKLQVAREKEADATMLTLNITAIGGALISTLLAIGLGFLIASRITQRIKENIALIVSSSAEIAATTEQHERSASHQASAVNQTTTTMDELNASSRQAAEQAESATTGAKAIAEQVVRLSEQTKQISSIATIVSDLANQTNMLALNAAVEAARAGEHGKGFGVVASEIRKLADQSKQSVERINVLVIQIQSIIEAAVVDTGEGSRVDSIVAAINNIVFNSQRIALTAKQQAIAIEQVVVAMNAVNEGAVQTASGISQTKVGIQRLNEAALNLQEVV